MNTWRIVLLQSNTNCKHVIKRVSRCITANLNAKNRQWSCPLQNLRCLSFYPTTKLYSTIFTLIIITTLTHPNRPSRPNMGLGQWLCKFGGRYKYKYQIFDLQNARIPLAKNHYEEKEEHEPVALCRTKMIDTVKCPDGSRFSKSDRPAQ